MQVHGERVHAFPARPFVQKRKKKKIKHSFKLTKDRGENIRHFLKKRKKRERRRGRERERLCEEHL